MFDKVYIMTITIVLQMKEVDVCKWYIKEVNCKI